MLPINQKHVCPVILGILLLFSHVSPVQADGQRDLEVSRGPAPAGADAATVTDRLPPVFPGEEVHDGDKRLKMWSTSGPVPVSRAPEPWREESNYGLRLDQGVGIVVDARTSNSKSNNSNSSDRMKPETKGNINVSPQR